MRSFEAVIVKNHQRRLNVVDEIVHLLEANWPITDEIRVSKDIFGLSIGRNG
jgi:hypothetical protein